jgi:uncharacterized protein YkwD
MIEYKLMKYVVALILALAIIFTTSIVVSEKHRNTPQSSNKIQVQQLTPGEIKEQLVDLTNEQRDKSGLGKLAPYEPLYNSAQAKCEDMQTNRYYDHGDILQFIKVDSDLVGENLAQNYKEPKYLVSGWMNSPKHRENILQPEFTLIGFGVCDGPEGYLIVQHFSTPIL